ncbi:MAG TPA: radical SAM protein [Spirochaetota bacterium]|nr:radical SAM protein [Spirochaetota bacterium]HPJ40936.1 radical SAM protein [Spirochaetota bacterium]HPR37815.1 radical SAM protein [Spirochaetota bacterium]HRX46612.1 radical SAM protein [Spirochaetota bacterium]
MDYVGHVIRPPSEAYSMIIQVTVGCSHNMCTFCGAYKDLKPKFWVKDWETVKRDIDEASSYRYGFKRAFLADGDVLILPTEDILRIMNYIKQKNPNIESINVYGNAKAILRKSPEDLKALHEAGLSVIYQGIESGNKDVLRKIRKGAFPDKMKEAAAKVIDSGIKLSQTVLLGIGGKEMSFEHARDTGRLLGEMSPDFASALTVMILPNTPLFQEYREGKFVLPDKFELLKELQIIIKNMNVRRKCYFTSNHASNYLPIKANLPEDQVAVLKMIDKVVTTKNESILRREETRAL